MRLLIDAGVGSTPLSGTSETVRDMVLHHERRELVVSALVRVGAKTGEDVLKATTTSYDRDKESESDESDTSELLDDDDIKELIKTATRMASDLEQNTTLTPTVKKKVLQFLMRDLVLVFTDFNEIDNENSDRGSMIEPAIESRTTAKDLWREAVVRWNEMTHVQHILSDEP